MLPYGVLAIRTYDGVELFPDEVSDVIRDIQIPPEKLFQMEILDRFDCAEISKKKYTKWFDYDKIKGRLTLRKRRPGDIIAVDDAGHHKKLNRFMIDRKIPQHIRDSLWIIAEGDSVIWLVGERIGADYKVTEQTKRVLEITIAGECEDE